MELITDTLRKRYFYKLGTNLVGFLISLVTAGIAPRALGVVDYGSFNFATNSITQVLGLLDFRTSTCFFTKLSQRQDENNLVVFYTYLTLAIFSLLSLFVIVVLVSPFAQYVFPGQSKDVMMGALLLVMLTWIVEILTRVLDAKGATVVLEKTRIVCRLVGTVLLVLLFIAHRLNLPIYFFYQYFITSLLIVSLYYWLKQVGYRLSLFPIVDRKLLTWYGREFYSYSAPLGFYVILVFIEIFFDRWLLQLYGGSYQQGLYSFSFNLTNFCFIFITALIPLFTRELSVAAGKNDIEQSAKLFRRYVPSLYAITAYFCCFIFVEFDNVIRLIGGAQYLGAGLTMKILAFYPLVSTYSNLNGSVIYAFGKTSVFLKLSLIFVPISLISSYVLMSNSGLGLNLGASGLAMKNLAIEFISVIVILKLNTSFLRLKFWKFMIHMVGSVFPFIILAYCSHLFIAHVYSSSFVLGKFISSGILYSGLVTVILISFPLFFGLHKSDISSLLEKITQRIRV